jgi:uncharacterized membrane protein
VEPFSPIRAATVHPALVHVTLGVVPVILVAYALAVARRSERWSFAGDVALWVGAAFTVATAASGLVANALVPWPGGLGTWRWLHLGTAVASTAALLALALVRLRASRRGALAGPRTLAAALGLSVLLGATGWIGGEVLVFHSGVAVAAAAQGALAPTISRSHAPPRHIKEAMGRLRGAWAEARTAHDHMLVQRPTPEGYGRIAAAAADLARDAQWLEAEGPRHAEEHGGPEVAATVGEMAGILRQRAGQLEAAAVARRWSGVTQALASVTSTCAGCHEAARWNAGHGPQARPP